MSDDAATAQGNVVGMAVVVFMREPERTQVQQYRVPLTAQQGMSLMNFIKHRLQGGRLTLTALPEEKLIAEP